MSKQSNNNSFKSQRVSQLKLEIERVSAHLATLRKELDAELATSTPNRPDRLSTSPVRTTTEGVNRLSPPAEKIALFRSLFQGRPDAYAVRWTNVRTGSSGWSPAVRGGYYSEDKSDSDLLRLDDGVIERHLTGTGSSTRSGPDLHVGIYPMLQDDTCKLLVCDFDGGSWRADAGAYADACRLAGVPCAVEVSRSGSGAHVWIFFAQAVEARAARALGAALLRSAMTVEPGISLGSYDRFFPAQDVLPSRSPGRHRLGNLIALPLQGTCRRNGTTTFVDSTTWTPYEDQFAFLASLGLVTTPELKDVIANLTRLEADPTTTPEPLPRLHPQVNPREAPNIVRIRLGAQVSVKKTALPPRVEATLKHLASVPNPEFYRKQAQRFSTFGTPRFVVCFEDDGAILRLPRGLLEAIRMSLDSARLRSIVCNELPEQPSTVHEFHGELQSDQTTALQELLSHDTGVLVAPPGSGKTVIACAMIAERQVPTAIIVNRAELATQWRARLSQFLGVEPSKVGQLGAGRRKLNGRLDIIMLQSISHRTADPGLLSKYGLVIVDECHAVAAPAAQAAINQVAARFWLGLTATPFRADQMNELITMQCGPIRHEMKERGTREKYLIVSRTRFSTHEPGTDGASIQAIYGELAANGERNALILDDIVDAFLAGRRSIVLSNRVQHVKHLAEALLSRVSAVHILHGSLTRRERAATVEALKNDKGRPAILVAIDKVAGEGLDLPGFDSIFLTMPVSFKGKVIQQIGRIARGDPDDSPSAYVYDYDDALVPILERMHRKRLRLMQQQGFSRKKPATQA